MWEYQVSQLTKQGLRCITYDRRGFGKSDRPFDGYDYDTLAGDLKNLLDELELKDMTLAGFSMGAGEIAKYFSLFGGKRVAKVVIVSGVTPYMLKTDSNPEGVPQEEFDKMAKGMMEDRPAFMENFNKYFFSVSLTNHPVSDAFLANSLTKVMDASAIATLKYAQSFSSTDFRKDITKINLPTSIIHGDNDKNSTHKSNRRKNCTNDQRLKIYCI
jgi:non-heme chloroperoxidase